MRENIVVIKVVEIKENMYVFLEDTLKRSRCNSYIYKSRKSDDDDDVASQTCSYFKIIFENPFET